MKVQLRDKDGNPETIDLTVIDWGNPTTTTFSWPRRCGSPATCIVDAATSLALLMASRLFLLSSRHRMSRSRPRTMRNLRDYRGQSIPQLFHPNAFILLSNGSETKVGTLTSEWEHFFEWKRIADEQEAGRGLARACAARTL